MGIEPTPEELEAAGQQWSAFVKESNEHLTKMVNRPPVDGLINLRFAITGELQKVEASVRICIETREQSTLCLEIAQRIHQSLCKLQDQINARENTTNTCGA